MALVYLGLGSNLGDGKSNLDCALALLNKEAGAVKAVSTYMESEPWGFVSEHRFTNAVCAIETTFGPVELLECTQSIERQMGRTGKRLPGESYKDRVIDIDILWFDVTPEQPEGIRVQSERLQLPHPLIRERDFVAGPLQECQTRLVSGNKQSPLG